MSQLLARRIVLNAIRSKPGRAQRGPSAGVRTSSVRAVAPQWARTLAAAVVGFVMAASLSGGPVQLWTWLQVGVLSGIAVGLVAPSLLVAGLVGAFAGALGLLVGRQNPSIAQHSIQLSEFVYCAAAALSSAGLVSWMVRRDARVARYLCWMVVFLVVANLWVTTLALNAQGRPDSATGALGPSFNQQLKGAGAPGLGDGADKELYSNTGRAVVSGRPYYSSYREAWLKWTGGLPPSSVTNVRFPLMIYLWGALKGETIVLAFLVLATAAILCLVPLASAFVRSPLALPACAALAAYLMHFGLGFTIYVAEAWAACMALFALAAYASAANRVRWRPWAVASVLAAVAAVLLRETMVIVLLSGLVAALFERGDRRPLLLRLWIGGLAAVVAAYSVHYVLASRIVDAASTYTQFRAGGLWWLSAALKYGGLFLGDGVWLAPLLAVAGMVGALVVPDRGVRVFALASVAVPLVAFLVFANPNVDPFTGVAENYWGAAVLPLAIGCAPWAFLLLPGMSSVRKVGSSRVGAS